MKQALIIGVAISHNTEQSHRDKSIVAEAEKFSTNTQLTRLQHVEFSGKNSSLKKKNMKIQLRNCFYGLNIKCFD